jgi:adenosylmethionine-8-amino-7-oxononanoate aminotransferase
MKNESHIIYRRLQHHHPIAERGEGIYLWDRDGRRYIDGSGGAAVVNIGHGVMEVVQAMTEQASQVAYVHGTMFTTEVLEKHANRMADLVPMNDPRFYYMSSGSEAVETAIKFTRQVQLARGEPTREVVISRWGSYHGATLGALAVTGRPKMRTHFTPLLNDQPHIQPPYCYRCPFGDTPSSCKVECAQDLENEIIKQGSERVAAFIAESVGGATLGAVAPQGGYWQRVAEICKKYGILLIVDEVMAGMGRTGRWFGIEHFGVEPDVIAMGKGVTSGYFPLSVIAVQEKDVAAIRRAHGDFSHGGTYSHHAVGAAAGLAVLDYIEKHDLVTAAAERGRYLGGKLREKLIELDCVGDVRGLGMLWGIEFVADQKTKAPFSPEAQFSRRVADLAFERGVIFYPGAGSVDGVQGDHILVAPPFVITEEEIDEVVKVIKGAIEDVQTSGLQKTKA